MEKRYQAEVAWKVAQGLVTLLSHVCGRIEIVGSLRRNRTDVGDIELLCIPAIGYERGLFQGVMRKYDKLDRAIKGLIKDTVLALRPNKNGVTAYGEKNKLLVHLESGIPVDIFSTTDDCWWVALVVRTGPAESNITLSKAAISMGLRFNAYGSGFTGPGDRKIVCNSEQEVFELVGLPYLKPEER